MATVVITKLRKQLAEAWEVNDRLARRVLQLESMMMRLDIPLPPAELPLHDELHESRAPESPEEMMGSEIEPVAKGERVFRWPKRKRTHEQQSQTLHNVVDNKQLESDFRYKQNVEDLNTEQLSSAHNESNPNQADTKVLNPKAGFAEMNLSTLKNHKNIHYTDLDRRQQESNPSSSLSDEMAQWARVDGAESDLPSDVDFELTRKRDREVIVINNTAEPIKKDARKEEVDLGADVGPALHSAFRSGSSGSSRPGTHRLNKRVYTHVEEPSDASLAADPHDSGDISVRVPRQSLKIRSPKKL